MRRLHERAAHLEVNAVRRVIPVREVRDELEQRLAKVFVRRTRIAAAHLGQELPRLPLALDGPSMPCAAFGCRGSSTVRHSK